MDRAGVWPAGTASTPSEEETARAPILRLVLGVAFLVFTVLIHWEVKINKPFHMNGSVHELGQIKVGGLAPQFTASDLDGKQIALADFKGEKIVLLDFWATWCPPCRMAMGTLRDMKDTLEADGVEVLQVDQGESSDHVRSFLAEHESDFRTVLDSDDSIAASYGVSSLPTMVLVDKTGVVRWIHIGHMPGTASDELRTAIRSVTGGTQ